MRDEILRAVEGAIANSSPAPFNETDTCFKVIYPLLLAVGYSPLEIRSQDLDAAKQKPDFTLLPDLPEHCWFLEAKAWQVQLDDSHAQQAINYANTQGKRWVVLTNGQDWRLYDNHIIGTAETKLAARAALKDETFASFLEAISRPSITLGKLEPYVRNQRLYSALAVQVVNSKSDVIRAISKVVRGLPGLGNVSGDEIVSFFRDGSATSSTVDKSSKTNKAGSGSESRSPESSPASLSILRLSKVAGEQVTHRKPSYLQLGDGTTLRSDRWYDITIRLVEHLMMKGLLTQVPVYIGPRAKSPCVAAHGPDTVKMRAPVDVSFGGKTLAVETHYSAIDHVITWRAILVATGLPTQDCQLVLLD